jgi:sarcosine oxidase gamma subunit
MQGWQRHIVVTGFTAGLCALLAGDALTQGRGGRGQLPARDAVRQAPTGTGVITGRVVALDTGRPIKRARVVVTGGGRPFSATSDDEGRFRVDALPAANYTITATKTGYVDGVHGQRRPGAPGTPVAVSDGQQVAGITLGLMRGGVITGHVADEDGDPLAQAIVTVHRQRFVNGERQLTPAGVDQSDDRGQFRVFGLPPGDYFVSATAGGIERLAQQFLPMLGLPGGSTAETTGYAATYYPGVIEPAQAARVRLEPGQEMAGIDFPLQLVALATVRGVVAGGPATVMLVPEGSTGAGMGGGRGGIGAMAGGGRGGAMGGGLNAIIGAAVGGALRGGGLRATTQADGSFVIPNVSPGRYTIVARGGQASADAGATTGTAIQPLAVSGVEISVALTLAPGVSAAGTVTLEADGANVPGALTAFRVTLTPLGAAAAVPRPGRPPQTDERGEFAVTDLIPGHYLVRGTAPQGWTLKAVYVDGRDATDQALEIGAHGASGINAIFTDRLTTLSGAVRDGTGAAPAGITVIAYPEDDAMWHSHSRHIASARTGQDGSYRFSGLPPADYLVVAVDDVEQGEWFDPSFLERMRRHAVRVRLGEGDAQVQAVRLAGS